MDKTSLGEENEKAILEELAPIIDKWAKKTKNDIDVIQRAVSYLWKDRQKEVDKSYRDWLSANEIGPFGGR
jgi:hypothetical protein